MLDSLAWKINYVHLLPLLCIWPTASGVSRVQIKIHMILNYFFVICLRHYQLAEGIKLQCDVPSRI